MDPHKNPPFTLPNHTLSRPMWLLEHSVDINQNLASCDGCNSSIRCDDAVRRAMAHIVPGGCHPPENGNVAIPRACSSPCMSNPFMSNTPGANAFNKLNPFGPFNTDPGFITYNSPPSNCATNNFNNNGFNMPRTGTGPFPTHEGINVQIGVNSGQIPFRLTQGQARAGGQHPSIGLHFQGRSPGEFPSSETNLDQTDPYAGSKIKDEGGNPSIQQSNRFPGRSPLPEYEKSPIKQNERDADYNRPGTNLEPQPLHPTTIQSGEGNQLQPSFSTLSGKSPDHTGSISTRPDTQGFVGLTRSTIDKPETSGTSPRASSYYTSRPDGVSLPSDNLVKFKYTPGDSFPGIIDDPPLPQAGTAGSDRTQTRSFPDDHSSGQPVNPQQTGSNLRQPEFQGITRIAEGAASQPLHVSISIQGVGGPGKILPFRGVNSQGIGSSGPISSPEQINSKGGAPGQLPFFRENQSKISNQPNIGSNFVNPSWMPSNQMSAQNPERNQQFGGAPDEKRIFSNQASSPSSSGFNASPGGPKQYPTSGTNVDRTDPYAGSKINDRDGIPVNQQSNRFPGRNPSPEYEKSHINQNERDDDYNPQGTNFEPQRPLGSSYIQPGEGNQLQPSFNDRQYSFPRIDNPPLLPQGGTTGSDSTRTRSFPGDQSSGQPLNPQQTGSNLRQDVSQGIPRTGEGAPYRPVPIIETPKVSRGLLGKPTEPSNQLTFGIPRAEDAGLYPGRQGYVPPGTVGGASGPNIDFRKFGQPDGSATKNKMSPQEYPYPSSGNLSGKPPVVLSGVQPEYDGSLYNSNKPETGRKDNGSRNSGPEGGQNTGNRTQGPFSRENLSAAGNQPNIGSEFVNPSWIPSNQLSAENPERNQQFGGATDEKRISSNQASSPSGSGLNAPPGGPEQFPTSGINLDRTDPYAGSKIKDGGGKPGNQQSNGFPGRNPSPENEKSRPNQNERDDDYNRPDINFEPQPLGRTTIQSGDGKTLQPNFNTSSGKSPGHTGSSIQPNRQGFRGLTPSTIDKPETAGTSPGATSYYPSTPDGVSLPSDNLVKSTPGDSFPGIGNPQLPQAGTTGSDRTQTRSFPGDHSSGQPVNPQQIGSNLRQPEFQGTARTGYYPSTPDGISSPSDNLVKSTPGDSFPEIDNQPLLQAGTTGSDRIQTRSFPGDHSSSQPVNPQQTGSNLHQPEFQGISRTAEGAASQPVPMSTSIPGVGGPGQILPFRGVNSQGIGSSGSISSPEEINSVGGTPGQLPLSGENLSTISNQPNIDSNFVNPSWIPSNQLSAENPERNQQFGGAPDEKRISSNQAGGPSGSGFNASPGGPEQFPTSGTNLGVKAGNKIKDEGGKPGNQQSNRFPSPENEKSHPNKNERDDDYNRPGTNFEPQPLRPTTIQSGEGNQLQPSFSTLSGKSPDHTGPISTQPDSDTQGFRGLTPSTIDKPETGGTSPGATSYYPSTPDGVSLPSDNLLKSAPGDSFPGIDNQPLPQGGTTGSDRTQTRSFPGDQSSGQPVNPQQTESNLPQPEFEGSARTGEGAPYRPVPIIESPKVSRGSLGKTTKPSNQLTFGIPRAGDKGLYPGRQGYVPTGTVDGASGPDIDFRKFSQPDGSVVKNKRSPKEYPHPQSGNISGKPSVLMFGGQPEYDGILYNSNKPGTGPKDTGSRKSGREGGKNAGNARNLAPGQTRSKNTIPSTEENESPINKSGTRGSSAPGVRQDSSVRGGVGLPENPLNRKGVSPNRSRILKDQSRAQPGKSQGNYQPSQPENQRAARPHRSGPVDQSQNIQPVKPNKLKGSSNGRRCSTNGVDLRQSKPQVGEAAKLRNQKSPYQSLPAINLLNPRKGFDNGGKRVWHSATQVKPPSLRHKKGQCPPIATHDILIQQYDSALADAVKKAKKYQDILCLPGSPYVNYKKLLGMEADRTRYSSPYGNNNNQKGNKNTQCRTSSPRPGAVPRKCRNAFTQDVVDFDYLPNLSNPNGTCRNSGSLYHDDLVKIPIRPSTAGNKRPALSQKELIAQARFQRLQINPEKIMKKYQSEKEYEEKWRRIRAREYERLMKEYLDEIEGQEEQSRRIKSRISNPRRNPDYNSLGSVSEQPSRSGLDEPTDSSTFLPHKRKGQFDIDEPRPGQHSRQRNFLDFSNCRSAPHIPGSLLQLRAEFDTYLDRFAAALRAAHRDVVDDLCPPFDLSIGHPLNDSRPSPLDRTYRSQPPQSGLSRSSPGYDDNDNRCQSGYPSGSTQKRCWVPCEQQRPCTPPPLSSCYEKCYPYRIFSVDQLNPSTYKNYRIGINEVENQRNRSKEKELNSVDANMEWLNSSGIFSIARPTSRQRFVSSPSTSLSSSVVDIVEKNSKVEDEPGLSMGSVDKLLAKLISSNPPEDFEEKVAEAQEESKVLDDGLAKPTSSVKPNPPNVLDGNATGTIVPDEEFNSSSTPVSNQPDVLKENISVVGENSLILNDHSSVSSSDAQTQSVPVPENASNIGHMSPDDPLSSEETTESGIKLKDSSDSEGNNPPSPNLPDNITVSLNLTEADKTIIEEIKIVPSLADTEEGKCESDEEIINDVMDELLECNDIIADERHLYLKSQNVHKSDTESTVQRGRRRVETIESPTKEIESILSVDVEFTEDPVEEFFSNESELEMSLESVSSEYLMPNPRFIVKFNEELPTLVSSLRKPLKSDDGDSSDSSACVSVISKGRDKSVRFDPVLQTQVFEKEDSPPESLDSSSESEFSDFEIENPAQNAPRAERTPSVTSFFGNIHSPGTGACGYYRAMFRNSQNTPQSISKAVGQPSTDYLISTRRSSSDTAINNLGVTFNFTTNENLSLESVTDKLKNEEEAQERLETIIQRWDDKTTSGFFSRSNDDSTKE